MKLSIPFTNLFVINLVVIALVTTLSACSGDSNSSSNKQAFDPDTMSMELRECDATSDKVGYVGEFETFSHDVSGTATILDNCNIQISNFTYDGGGPEVFFYAGPADFDYESEDAFAIWDTISGITFDGDDFIISLPEGKSVDDLETLAV